MIVSQLKKSSSETGPAVNIPSGDPLDTSCLYSVINRLVATARDIVADVFWIVVVYLVCSFVNFVVFVIMLYWSGWSGPSLIVTVTTNA
jgi:hypothetical protein